MANWVITMRPLLLILLLLSGCDESFTAYVEAERAKLPTPTYLTGDSNGRRTPANRQALIIPWDYKKLRAGLIAVRIDGPNTWTAHPLAYREGPLWVMWGSNGQTNPVPDERRLTPSNYLGVLADPSTRKPL